MSNNSNSILQKFLFWLKNSIVLRLLTIGILIIILLIPVGMIQDLIREREYRQQNVKLEMSSKWGGSQNVAGLVLTIPYLSKTKVHDGSEAKFKIVETRSYAHFLPYELNIEGEVSPETRYRGIYEVVVYNANVNLNGRFKKPDLDRWKIPEEDILWDEAFVALGLSDLRSIQESVKLDWKDKAYPFNPGIETNAVIKKGLSTPVDISSKDQDFINFKLALNFNGSSNLSFVPLGRTTQVALHSTWKDPSFDGAFLPDERTISKDGFNAKWKILHLNRPFPQAFTQLSSPIGGSAFGVNLIVPVDEYQKSMRSAKYAAMLISLTFLVFFFIQILNKISIHPVQYILVGLALVIFYTLLIALSEHIAFKWSYLISSFAVIALVSLYVNSIFKNQKLSLAISGILIILYGFIYTIIQLKDYALLMGATGLFLVLAIVMYLSRKIDWYTIRSETIVENEIV